MLELAKQKGFYPFEYMESLEIFSEDKLSDRSKCFSSVKNKHISEKKKKLTSINVWNAFKINTMGDYHGLYLKTDVLLLADKVH